MKLGQTVWMHNETGLIFIFEWSNYYDRKYIISRVYGRSLCTIQKAKRYFTYIGKF